MGSRTGSRFSAFTGFGLSATIMDTILVILDRLASFSAFTGFGLSATSNSSTVFYVVGMVSVPSQALASLLRKDEVLFLHSH